MLRPWLRRWRRALLWSALLLLLGVAQSLLLLLTLRHESARAQDEIEGVAAAAAVDLRRDLLRRVQALQSLMWTEPTLTHWRDGAGELLRSHRELLRVERRDDRQRIGEVVDSPYAPGLFSQMPREALDVDTALACAAARRAATPTFSGSYFVPLPDGQGAEVMDLCVPVSQGGRDGGFLVATFALAPMLEGVLPPRGARQHELSFVGGDGARLARAGKQRGAGVFVAERNVDLPGATLQLRVDGVGGHPSLVPNVATALVLGLSIALFGVVLLLVRDVRRRALAEQGLAETLAFRQAMEDSLVTGLRARDLRGAITYVNPAFCAMVGVSAQELLAPSPSARPSAPPYWPPEFAEEYGRRQQALLLGGGRSGQSPGGEVPSRAAEGAQPGGKLDGAPPGRNIDGALPGRNVDGALPGAGRESREGFETVFMRKSGERFPVMIYEAPLVDGAGRHTGWMSAVLDISAQRRAEELSRQQQDRLQATARLATVGEMASLLSHELNQPLAAISSYASGGVNLIDEPVPPGGAAGGDAGGHAGGAVAADAALRTLLRQALERIGEQADRAGRVIRSVNDFVRRRDSQRETLAAGQLLDAVLPLVRLQARKSGTRIEIDLPNAQASALPLQVVCDRTMVEQVLLNLSRNAVQAMETATPLAQRLLTLQVRQTHPRWVGFSVIDAGPGIAPDVARRLFTPFFTTRSEGMGLGLSLCRTVIEQHGGALDFGPGPGACGTEFRFTLPAPRGHEGAESGDTVGAGSGSGPGPANPSA